MKINTSQTYSINGKRGIGKGRGRPRKVVKDVAPIVPKKRGRPSKIREKFDSEESEAKDETGDEDSDADLPEISLEEPGTLTTDADKDEAYQPFDTKLAASSVTTHETYSSEGRTSDNNMKEMAL
ncbi:hypothetical protein H4Q26_009093 [Puccinia striiformis f. sp. tritici PST-130]|nr:hypothetical protein H4Q26_009093 [Puccinia striiformis f. sp. tritici PST-130]